MSLFNGNVKSAIYSEKYDSFMFVICVLYCVTALPGLDVNSLFKNVILIGSAPLFYFLCKDKTCDKTIVYLFGLSFFIQIISWVNSLFVIPDVAKNYPDVKALSSLFLFVFISFWIRNDRKRRVILLSSFLISFFITLVVHNYYHDSFSLALQGVRVDFDLHNAQYTTMLAATSIMVSFLLLFSIDNIKARPVLIVLLIAAIAFGFFVFVVSQSRQVWLAFAVLLLLLPAVFYKKIGKRVTLGAYALLFILSFSLLSSDIVQKRFDDSRRSGDLDVAVQVFNGNWDDIPMTSWGIRFNSWLEASEWIKENPVLGASKAAIKQVLKTSERFQSSPRTSGFGHLHNYYLETLVSFGIVGLVFVVCFYTVITKNVLTYADYSTSVFFVLFLIFWLFINNFESYNSKYYGFYMQNIILGALFYIPRPKNLAVEST